MMTEILFKYKPEIFFFGYYVYFVSVAALLCLPPHKPLWTVTIDLRNERIWTALNDVTFISNFIKICNGFQLKTRGRTIRHGLLRRSRRPLHTNWAKNA